MQINTKPGVIMKTKLLTAMIVILIGVLFVNVQAGETTGATSKDNEINYFKYEDGLKKAESDSLHVVILFETDWCGWCKKMDKTTLSDPKIIELMSDNFVAIKVNGDKRRDLTKSFGVRGYPATWFLKHDGTRLAPIQGYWKAADFYWLLKYIAESAYEKEEFKAWVDAQKKIDNN